MITFQCPACSQVLKVAAENAGKRAKCVKCGTIVNIPAGTDVAAPAPPPRSASRQSDFDFEDRGPPRRRDDYDDAPRRRPRDDYEDDYDRPRRRSRDDYDRDYDDRRSGKPWGNWPKVQLGMLLHTIASGVLIGFAGLMILAFLFRIIATATASPTGGSSGECMIKTAGIFGFIACILIFAVEIPYVIGYVFCLFTPNRRGGMALAITVLAIAGTSLILK